MTVPGHVRHGIVFQGNVQGVGFRFTTEQIANRHNVTGWIRNMPDRTVYCEIEGEPGVIADFLAEVHETMSGYIVDTQEHQSEATGEFKGFEVRYR